MDSLSAWKISTIKWVFVDAWKAQKLKNMLAIDAKLNTARL